MSDTFITKSIPFPRSYPQAVLYRGIEAVYNVTGDASYFNYIQTSLDAIVDSKGNPGDAPPSSPSTTSASVPSSSTYTAKPATSATKPPPQGAQDASGGWWLIMDEPYPGMKGNYIETSGTAMFAYALLKGGRLGYIDSATYQTTAIKAYDLLTKKYVMENSKGELDWEGTVSVGSLGGDGSYEYYISQVLTQNDLKGVGTFIFLSVEKEAL
ncbi:hypothetical protein VE02_08718 [Pseudogymnoascus sp. 03VT05]|nr:hypothetical protein VE02_08718 [Pseudogymnoascus sp. 03VT05]